MTILIHIGQRQNSSSSYFTSCGEIDSAFKLSECKQESECKFPMSSRAAAGAGVTFLETGAGAKKSDSDHLCLSRGVQFFSFPTHVLRIKKKSSCAIQFKRHVLNTSWTVCTRTIASSESEHTNVSYGKAAESQATIEQIQNTEFVFNISCC